MTQAVIILAHRYFPQLKRLIAYFDGQCDIYIHVDRSGSISSAEMKMLTTLPGVRRVESRYKVRWGGFSILQTEIYMMKLVVKDCKPHFVHLISGQDYPIRPLNEFISFFTHTKMYGFCACGPLVTEDGVSQSPFHKLQYFVLTDFLNGKDPKESPKIWNFIEWQKRHKIRRRIPDQVNKLYSGSAWFSFHRKVIEYIVEYTTKHPGFYRRMRFTFVPEETYITSVALNSPYQHLITRNNDCRIISWRNPGIDSSPIDMTIKDFPQLLTSQKAFFARKFAVPKSDRILTAIDSYLLKKEYPQKGNNGIWNNYYLCNYIYDSGLLKGLIEFCFNYKIKSICDLGCGPGWYVTQMRNKGISAVGYDGNPHTNELVNLMTGDNDDNCCGVADISEEIDSDLPFEVVLFLCVGEYISKDKESIIFNNLIRNSSRYIIMAWDEDKFNPDNINPLPKEYIINKITSSGKFIYNEIGTQLLRQYCHIPIYKKSILIFQRIDLIKL